MKVIMIVFTCIIVSFCSCQNDELDPISPDEVSNIEIYYYADSLKLFWDDPLTNDLNRIEIETENDVFIVEKDVETIVFESIDHNLEFVFTIRTINNSGIKSQGVCISGMYDYRKDFLGTFEFLSYITTTHLATTYISDSTIHLGSIFYGDNLDSSLSIEYRPGVQTGCFNEGEFIFGGNIELLINNAGELLYPELTNCAENSSFSGQFFNSDSLVFSITIYDDRLATGQVVKGTKVR
jgi:hypothetical protein